MIEFEGQSYAVDMAYDTVLHVIDILSDPDEDEMFKVNLTICLMLDWDMEDLDSYTFESLWQLFESLMTHINLGENKEDGGDTGPQQRVMDYTQDAEAIYASFFYAYKLDLFEQQGKLHYRKFISLLQHLHKDTAFKEIVGYRTMKVPNKKEASDDYIRHIKKMKRLYRLDEDDVSVEEDRDARLSAIGNRFKSKQ